MKLSKITTTVITIIFMAGLASASTADLTIFPKESNTEIDSFTSYEVEIENIGEVKDVYHLSSETSEIDIAPRKVELQPQQSETINVWYNPNTDKDEGKYDFKVKARSRATGESYTVDGVAEVIKEHKIDLSVEDRSKTACLGHEATYEIELENDGIQDERFKLTTDRGDFSEDKVHIPEGESKVVELKTFSETPVQENINVVAASTTSYAKDSETLEFNVDECYSSELTSENQQEEVPARTSSNIQFTLKNTGTKADVFELISNGEKLDREPIEIEAGEEHNFNISVTPEELGTRQIGLTAVSNSESSVTVPVEAYNGMNSKVSFDDQEMNVCENHRAETDVEIENTGEATEKFNLSSNIGGLGEDSFELASGEDEDTELVFNAPDFEEGTQHTYRVTSTANTFNEPVSSAEGTLNIQNCWDMEMNVVPKVTSAGENKSTIYEIQVTNPGTEENTYQLSYDAPTWITVEPTELTVPAGETKKAYIYAGIPFQKKGEARITVNAEGTDVDETEEIKMKVGEEVDSSDLNEAVRDDSNQVQRSPGAIQRITGQASEITADQTGKVIGSIVVGALVTAGLLLS